MMKAFKSFILLLCMTAALTTALHANPLQRFSFSVWTDYSGMKLHGLSQEEKTAKLQKLFEDKLQFAKTYNARRVLIKILNPAEFDFFNTENYDATRDDNFYYWAMKLSQHAEIEAVFDPGYFDVGTQSWTDRLFGYAADWFKIESPLGSFRNLKQKLAWVSFVNEMDNPNGKQKPLIRGITIDPKDNADEVVQLIINILDQYKYNVSDELAANPYPSIRMGICLGLDKKDIALCNLSHFPLRTDLRGQQPNDIGVTPPGTFPSEGPQYHAPEWRKEINQPLLDTVYLQMADKRLVEAIYQNHEELPNPAVPNPDGVKMLGNYLARNLRGAPFIKGPGRISNPRGTTDVAGKYTFFRTGGGTYMQGQVLEGGAIDVLPPYVSQPTRKVLACQPESNKAVKLSSTFSTTEDLVDAEYYITATPVSWNVPKISNFVRAGIYYVFSTDFTPKENRFFGNWCLENFLDFLSHHHKHPKHQFGFLKQPVYTDFNGQWLSPVNNIVLYDFTTIPNGTPYPECNWELGNQTHN
ncbi:MAG: hypothetical protein KDK64_03095 [Chlamydiia bacterium]|nr:hypothetical protein [Chlamydiia bacterium]